MAFLARFHESSKEIYLPTPTWGNHIPIAKDSGLTVKHYKYFDKETVGLDFEGMKADIKAAPEGSIVSGPHTVYPVSRLHLSR